MNKEYTEQGRWQLQEANRIEFAHKNDGYNQCLQEIKSNLEQKLTNY